MSNGTNITAGQALDYLVKFLVGVTTVLVISIWTMMADLDTRVTAIEANRFTTADGLALWREVDKKVSRAELMDRLDHIEDMIAELREFHQNGM